MESAFKAFAVAQSISESVREIGLQPPTRVQRELEVDGPPTYDQIVDDDELRRATRALFLDGHYAQAVEEAYKCVNNTVKALSGLTHLDGVPLMQQAFSPNKPVLRLNSLTTVSEKDQQRGYMDLFGAVITGIRNPRAHEHAYLDDPVTALELLGMANHLVRIARSAQLAPDPQVGSST